MRGPAVLAGPLSPRNVPRVMGPREAFDTLVLALVEDLATRWEELRRVEFAVEEAPLLPEDWSASSVPLASLVPASGSTPTRLVLFRRPMELRCETRADLSAMILTVLVEQAAELLGRPPEEIDPRYDPDD